MEFIEQAELYSPWCALKFPEAEWLAISEDSHTDFWQRHGMTWVKHTSSHYGEHLLCSGVSDWLYSNVGYSFVDYWSMDRRYYNERDLPPLTDQPWEDIYEVVPLERRNWRCQPSQHRLLFRHKDHAALFKLAFHGIE